MTIDNAHVKQYSFLKGMLNDDYFPKHLVLKGVDILSNLCVTIEGNEPADLEALYQLTHAATEQFNALEEAFLDAGSEIETAAREIIGDDFVFIAHAYGFPEADVEELIAPRNW